MLNDLAGKRVLITGSTMGIGLGAARAFARCGAKVSINSLRALENLNALLAGMQAQSGEAAIFATDLPR